MNEALLANEYIACVARAKFYGFELVACQSGDFLIGSTTLTPFPFSTLAAVNGFLTGWQQHQLYVQLHPTQEKAP